MQQGLTSLVGETRIEPLGMESQVDFNQVFQNLVSKENRAQRKDRSFLFRPLVIKLEVEKGNKPFKQSIKKNFV